MLKRILCKLVDLRYGWATPWGSAIEERMLKPSRPMLARDPAAKRMFSARKRSDSKCFICAKAKRQQQQQQSGSSDAPMKAPSRNGNQPLAMVMILLSGF
ncbi:hypothetical protein ABE61_03500 [Lysinibacillus sphaericus]|nr:hypothetical protein [Lysinibacillus sphaericus]MBG9477871.1 hypothetical protein [Lysinibacillus sphaericus]MBG9592221.1 hypothetical protein [Lysinibacillus sphaericus]